MRSFNFIIIYPFFFQDFDGARAVDRGNEAKPTKDQIQVIF